MRLVIAFCLACVTLGCHADPTASRPAPKLLASLLSDPRNHFESAAQRIEAARSFVHNSKDQFTATDLVVAHYLERRFGESFGINYATALSSQTKRCAVFKFNAPALGLTPVNEFAPNDDYIGRAFQCQSHALPPGFWNDVKFYTDQEPKGLDNVAVAVQIALEQGCIEQDPHMLDFQKHQFGVLKEILSAPKAQVDTLYLKRLAAWLYMKAGPADAAWIDRVEAAQLEHGGWAANEASGLAAVGASLLGYWVLLETVSDTKPADVHFVEGKVAKAPSNSPRPYELP